MNDFNDDLDLTHALSAGLKNILPPHVKSLVEAISHHSTCQKSALFLEEISLTKKMSPKRLNDFKAGRLATRSLLSQFGIDHYPLLIGDNRAPIWPKQLTGSISHSENLCIVAIAEKSHHESIGIDIESVKPINPDIVPLICSTVEIDLMEEQAHSHNISVLLQAKRIFSIKESIFKCLNPIINHWIDFKEMQVEVNPVNHIYIATPVTNNPELLKLGKVKGKWFTNEYFHMTSCCL